VTLRVFTHAQENKIALYGFFDHRRAPSCSIYLITVKNVGPSTAMRDPVRLAAARSIAELIAQASDVAGLTKHQAASARRPPSSWWSSCARSASCCSCRGTPRARCAPVASVPRRSAAVATRCSTEVIAALVGMGWKPLRG
jgi:hypothetical protein